MPNITLIIFFYILYQASASCDSRDLVQVETTKLGETVPFVCHLEKTCRGSKYRFYHVIKNGTIAQSRLVHQGGHWYNLNVRSLDDAGEYYCIEYCSEEADQDDNRRCWFNITIPVNVSCNLPEAINQYEDANGSCTFIGSPVPSSELLYIEHCNYQYNMTIVNQYTVRVDFIIRNATETCKIYYYSTNNPRTRTLPVINTAVNSDKVSHSTTRKLTSTFATTLTPTTVLTFKQTSILTPTPTRMIDQISSTHSPSTYSTSSPNIKPTTDTMETSQENDHVNTSSDQDDSNKDNNGMTIALLLLVVLLLVLSIINIMLNIMRWKKGRN